MNRIDWDQALLGLQTTVDYGAPLQCYIGSAIAQRPVGSGVVIHHRFLLGIYPSVVAAADMMHAIQVTNYPPEAGWTVSVSVDEVKRETLRFILKTVEESGDGH